jgi:cytochrome b involved in lipid metabolism
MDAKQEEKVIITVSGKKYDVTQWRYKHPGGDVYTNGADMTVAFMAQHGHDFSRLQPFEVKEEGDIEKQKDKNPAENGSKTESIQIIDRTDDAADTPKPYSMADLDKALQEELDEL